MLTPTDYTKLMEEAITLALIAQDHEEVPIGALIYHNNLGILGRGYNQTRKLNDPTAHAEILAIRTACQKLNNYRLLNCYLISTIEPCTLCLSASIHARVQGIYYGAHEPKMGAFTHAIMPPYRDAHLLYIQGGILEHQCADLMQNFFKKKRIKKPS